MLARNVTLSQLETAAEAAGVSLINYRPDGKTGARFRLQAKLTRTPGGRVPKSDPRKYCAVGHLGRRSANLCWHGHREFFRALFRVAPEARVQTTLLQKENRFNVLHGDLTRGTRWYTAENFETVYPLTAGLNVGSMYEPLLISDACECSE